MMQKIIAYVCYLENTVHDLCEKLDLKVGDLLMSTDFITEQLRTKKGTSISHLHMLLPVIQNFLTSEL